MMSPFIYTHDAIANTKVRFYIGNNLFEYESKCLQLNMQ